MLVVAVAPAPPTSWIATVTLYVPGVEYTCVPPNANPPDGLVAKVPPEVEPSPQLMVPLYCERLPFGSASVKVMPAPRG